MAPSRRRRVIKGQAISSGIALGRVRKILPEILRVAEIRIPESRVRTEIAALEEAVRQTAEELEQLKKSAGRKIAGSVTKIFDAQLLIAGDQEFLEGVKGEIAAKKRNAGFIYNKMVRETTQSLKSARDEYMRQMVGEIEAVAHRVLSHLAGFGETSHARFQQDTILIAKSFSPGEILSLRNRRAAGFVTTEGGPHSHMGLIARSLMVPVVMSPIALNSTQDDMRAIIDGSKGQVILNPTEVEWEEYDKIRKSHGPAVINRIKQLEEIPPRTLDGATIEIRSNLEFPGPVDEILSAQKIPVGLYRTEFLYLESDSFPDEESQSEFYLQIAQKFSGSHVVLRTFDLGSDKIKGNMDIQPEPNPALGWRGIRCMLEQPEVFKTQIRAILRSSVHDNVRILLPMVSDLGELKKARKLFAQAELELKREGIPFDQNMQIGIMIEVPSAALQAESLAKVADFVAIGTNDLTQYTMSADRANSKVAGLYDPMHPSVLKLIAQTVRACKANQTPVSICGEVAGDSLAVPLFVGMGVDALSMAPTKIFDCCRLVKRIDSQLARLLVAPVLASNSAASVRRKLQSYRSALDKKQP